MNSTKYRRGPCQNQADASDDAIAQLGVKKMVSNCITFANAATLMSTDVCPQSLIQRSDSCVVCGSLKGEANVSA